MSGFFDGSHDSRKKVIELGNGLRTDLYVYIFKFDGKKLASSFQYFEVQNAGQQIAPLSPQPLPVHSSFSPCLYF